MASSRGSSSEDVSAERERKHPSGPPKKGETWFPLSYKEGFSQWWAGTSPAATEHRVLSFIPYLQSPPTHTKTGTSSVTPSDSSTDLSTKSDVTDDHVVVERVTSNNKNDPYGPRTWHSNLVKLSGRNRALNEFSVERTGEDVENNLVMLHGYGAGLGFFYKNFEALSRAPGWKLYALDMLGMGRSTRPNFTIHAKDRQGKITEAENWFIDALEEWRVARKIEKFTLLGHSMGGYMAVAYALKYPGRLNKLILASPVGIPEDPYAVSADLPEPGESAMLNEFTQDQGETTSGSSARNGNTAQPPKRPYNKWFTYLWDANISPFSIIRWAGPLGPRLVSGWTARRFSHLPPEEGQALHDYSYSLFRQRGSGEYALAYILAPGAFARSPLIRRIQNVGRQYLQDHQGPVPDSLQNGQVAERPRENGLPVVLMYGEHDWMDVKGGRAAVEKMQAVKDEVLKGKSAEERKADQGEAKVTIIRRAGHHVYLDGFDQFNNEMLREMKDVERRQKLEASRK